MVRVEWQYYQTKNIARSSHFIPGPYFIYTQSAVRGPQSAVRPRFTVRSRSETLYPAALRTYNTARLQQKHTYQWKNIQIISLKTSRPWYRQALDCCWRNISPRDGSTRTWNTPSLQDDRHLICSRGTSGFTLPTRYSYIWSVFNFCFSLIRKSKNDFHFGFHHHWYCFPQFRYTWIALSSLNF